jgi:hypothetical protein
MDNPDVKTILLHRNGPAEEGKRSALSPQAAPKDAKKGLRKRAGSDQEKKFDDAQRTWKSSQVYPVFHGVVRGGNVAGQPGEDGHDPQVLTGVGHDRSSSAVALVSILECSLKVAESRGCDG